MLHTHQYYKKLLQIKKDMLDLHAKIGKIKVYCSLVMYTVYVFITLLFFQQRAKKLREHEEKEAENRRQKLHMLEKREQNIIAKPATGSSWLDLPFEKPIILSLLCMYFFEISILFFYFCRIYVFCDLNLLFMQYFCY